MSDKKYRLPFSAQDVEARLRKVDEIDTLSGRISAEVTELYVQDEEPINASDSALWVDTSEKGLETPDKIAARVFVEDLRTTDLTTVDFNKFSVGDVIVVTNS